MKKNEIKKLLMKMRTSQNEAFVNHLLGLMDMISDEDLSKKLKELNLNDENIEKFLNSKIEESQSKQEKSEHFINVNKMFCYGRTGDTIHMHLIPKDLRPIKEKIGDRAFYEYFKTQLEDFLCKLQNIFRDDNTIKTLFAVSPIFFNSNISMIHEMLGFDNITEIDIENKNDGMSIEQKENFLSMFNKDQNHIKKVFYTSMTRKKLLESVYAKIPEDAKNILD